MKKLLKHGVTTAFAMTLFASALYATAATTSENKDDGSSIGTSDSPQIKEQNKHLDKKSGQKSMKKNMSSHEKKMRMMDANNDGMVTREEYMSHQEKMYNDMKPSDSGISYKNSMNNKPIGTTTGSNKSGSVESTKQDRTSDTTTGTND